MRRHPLIVLADDLTGAAEIAAIAHQGGLRAVVHTAFPIARSDADVIVCNTDTRLLAPKRAAKRVAEISAQLRTRPNSGFFKKTDSVLRGPVLAEVKACVDALGYQRTLLVPCNPSLGRVIRDGRYYLGGQPLHKTAFLRDPHHPRTTADVCGLLEAAEDKTVACYAPSVRLPEAGVIVGEADTPADVLYWAGQVTTHTLPAGGADFFRAWLQTRRKAIRADVEPNELPTGATLLLSGTATPPNPVTPLPGRVFAISPRRIPSVAEHAKAVTAELERAGFASVAMSGALARNPRTPALLARFITDLAGSLYESGAFRHLIIAGGATAASVLQRLDWTRLEVLRVWGPGVVTLRPAGASRFAITLKPGSYAWPSSLSRYFDAAAANLETAAR